MTGEPGRDIDLDTVTRRLTHLRQVLDDLGSLDGVGAADLDRDRVTRYAVERMLTLVVELAVDVNAHVSARRLGRSPGDARTAFDLAAEAGLISQALASTLKPSVGLRNLLTHVYLPGDLDIPPASIPEAIDRYGEYVRQVARALQGSA